MAKKKSKQTTRATTARSAPAPIARATREATRKKISNLTRPATRPATVAKVAKETKVTRAAATTTRKTSAPRKKAATRSTDSLTETQRLARELGVAESTIRARRSRGQDLHAPRQIRLNKREQYNIARAKGTTAEVAETYGCSVSTVKRLRRLYGTTAR